VILGTNRLAVLPRIISISPLIGAPGTQVTITGSSFFDITRVDFNGTTAAFTVVSSTELRATVPNGARGGPIRVTTPDGTASSTAVFTVTGASDLEISKTGPATMPPLNQPFNYVINVANVGNAIMSGVKMTDPLPSGLRFISADVTAGTVVQTNQTVTWNLGLFTNGTFASMTLRVQAEAETVFTNTATVTAVETDLEPTTNVSSAYTAVFGNGSRTLRIDLNRAAGTAVVSWPTSGIPFRLQYRSDLVPGGFWSDLFATPSMAGGRMVITNDTFSEMEFYRLTF
jgi:uncharacterized repeat protein (TIGR01451 family)